MKLTVSNYDDSKTIERQGFVEVGKHGTVARIGLPSEGYLSPNVERFVAEGTKVTFTDRSPVDISTWQWILPGTETGSSTEQNPTVKYTNSGIYDVKLHVNNSEGEAEETIENAIQAGGEQYVWNISSEEKALISAFNYGFDSGFYGGNNTYLQDSFAEYFKQPSKTAYINKVNVYFGIAETVSPEAEIELSIAKSNTGFPGDVIATSRVKAANINTTIGEPTVFYFDETVEVASDFFIVIGGFPNAKKGDKADKIAVACVRRSPGEQTTTFYYQSKQDEEGTFYPYTWYKANENASSFAIAPLISYDQPTAISSLGREQADNKKGTYTIDGRRIANAETSKGIFIIDGKKIIK